MGDEKPWRDKYGDSVFGREAHFQQQEYLCRTCRDGVVNYSGDQCYSCRRDEGDDYPYRSRSQERAQYEARMKELNDAIRHKDDTLDRQARQIEKYTVEVDNFKYLLDQARKDLSIVQDRAAANTSALQRSQDLNAELRKQVTEDILLLDNKTQAIKDRETAIRALTLAVVALEKKLGRQIPDEQELRQNVQMTDVKCEKVEEKKESNVMTPSKLDLEWEQGEHKFRLAREVNFITLFKWLLICATWLATLVTMH